MLGHCKKSSDGNHVEEILRVGEGNSRHEFGRCKFCHQIGGDYGTTGLWENRIKIGTKREKKQNIVMIWKRNQKPINRSDS